MRKDPTGIVLMAEGAGGKSQGPTKVERVVIERAANGGVVVNVTKSPVSGGGNSLPMMGDSEMNAFASWPEALGFISEVMGSEMKGPEEEELEGPLVEASEEIQEPPIEAMGTGPESHPQGGVEFGGQRSYGS